jgi:hypothetical protein
MLARFFHAWEHRLAFSTTDRLVRPFEWGVDWIPSAAHGNGTPDAHVERWVEDVMRDTPAFFHAPPCSDFAFTASDSRRQAKGEAGTLTFPSALTTPHAENNVVTGRWFPAAGDERVTRAANRGRAVVVLPQWNSDAEGHVGLSRVLARFGI